MYTVITLPNHVAVRHMITTEGISSYQSDSRGIYLSAPATIDDIETDEDIQVYNLLVDLSNIGLVRYKQGDNSLETEPQAEANLKQCLPALAIGMRFLGSVNDDETWCTVMADGDLE